MRSLQTLSASATVLAGLAAAVPANNARGFNAPTSDGFPNPNQQQLSAIQDIAGGQLPNGPLPATLAASSLTAFQLIAFNENFEVAFFSSLIDNITAEAPGYTLEDDKAQKEVLEILETVRAQEEIHAIAAASVLENYGAFAPPPCTYKFPTSDIVSAVALAETFTALVLGTLQDASQLFAANGDAAPVRIIASVIGQEGEQTGWYRVLLGLRPSEKPFLTTSTASFAYSVLQGFVDSCPFDISEIAIPVFPPLTVNDGMSTVAPEDQTLCFSADLTDAPAGWDKWLGDTVCEGLYVTYLTGLNVPISEPISAVSWSGNVISFSASFPYDEYDMDGLSIAALTTSGNFTDPDAIPAATLAAPALIQADMPL